MSLLADAIALTDLIGEPLPFVGQLQPRLPVLVALSSRRHRQALRRPRAVLIGFVFEHGTYTLPRWPGPYVRAVTAEAILPPT